MKCVVCFASFTTGTVCPQCGWDQTSLASQDTSAVLAARNAFRARTVAYAPDSRVTRRDRAVPWLGLGLGMLLFLFVIASCSLLVR
jgi:hypothetical protein